MSWGIGIIPALAGHLGTVAIATGVGKFCLKFGKEEFNSQKLTWYNFIPFIEPTAVCNVSVVHEAHMKKMLATRHPTIVFSTCFSDLNCSLRLWWIADIATTGDGSGITHTQINIDLVAVLKRPNEVTP